MQQMRTEELMARAREAAESGDAASLCPAIESVISGTRKTWQQFVLTATEDPEMPAEARDAIASGLEAYIDCLEKMLSYAREGAGADLARTVEEAQNCVLRVREAQDAQRTRIAAGPTSFAYLNRLLIQYEGVRRGGDSQRLIALLDGGSTFLVWLRKELDSRAADPTDLQLVFHLQQFLEALQSAVDSQQDLPEVQDDIVHLASQLAAPLNQPPLESPAGPTPLAAVNGVLQALSECTDRPEEFEFLLSFIEQGRDSLRAAVPISSPPETISLLNAVLANLDRMEQSLRHTGDFEELVAAAGELEESGILLGQTLHGAEEADFVEQTNGMPLLFRSILEPAYRFWAGTAGAEMVFDAADHLQHSAAEMQHSVFQLDGSDERAQRMQEALELMTEAAEMLRELASNGNEKALEVATGILLQASELIKGMR